MRQSQFDAVGEWGVQTQPDGLEELLYPRLVAVMTVVGVPATTR